MPISAPERLPAAFVYLRSGTFRALLPREAIAAIDHLSTLPEPTSCPGLHHGARAAGAYWFTALEAGPDGLRLAPVYPVANSIVTQLAGRDDVAWGWEEVEMVKAPLDVLQFPSCFAVRSEALVGFAEYQGNIAFVCDPRLLRELLPRLDLLHAGIECLVEVHAT